jgi:hypothetical protein
MIERRIAGRLRPVAARFRRLQFAVTLSVGWLLVALLGTILWWARGRFGWELPGMTSGLLFLGLLALVVAVIRGLRVAGNYRAIAQRIESFFPDLDSRLLTAMEQQPSGGFLGGYSYLQESVIRQALRHEHHHAWRKVIPMGRIVTAHLACLLSLAYLAAVLAALAQGPQTTLARGEPDWQSIPAGTSFEVQVEPGDTELERGASLLVTARFAGPLPPEVDLLLTQEDGGEQRLPMRKSLDDPLFGVRVPDLQQPVNYRVEYSGQASDEYQVTLFEYPRLLRADARLVYPSYTNLDAREIQDVRRITAVEGTELTITCQVNKPLASATLVGRDQPSIELNADSQDTHRYRATWRLTGSDRYRLRLVDQQGREGKSPVAEFVVRVVPNREPDLKWTSPARDVSASPLEELALSGSVRDDFGVLQYGISYRLAGQEPQEVVLGSGVTDAKGEEFHYLLDLEALEAQPDQLVSYHLWADDYGSNGQPRRTYSDMFFAEIRHFEEIFRQGRQPAGDEQAGRQSPDGEEGGGGAQQAEELAELQKQIMTGTWNLIRRETGTEPSDAFASDVEVLKDSQLSALEQLEELGSSLQDPESLSYLDEARSYMQQAVQQLGQSLPYSTESLTDALNEEQAAYQSLLRLRAREHEVVRSSSSASSSSARSSASRGPSQQQLQQLDLRDSDDRYETERLANDLQNPAEREVRQAMNRLRELARRQGDLNERVKELQSALEQAADEEERQELERQLKRLREQQQEILRDTEELQQRMDREELQDRLSDAQQQLTDTRENVRRASEALEEGRLSEAVTSGTRAEREFQELQDELRQEASSQFEETVRSMRQQGRRLAERQTEMINELDQMIEEENRALRGSTLRESLQQGLEQQRQELDHLLEQMKETIQESEEAEPLLSRRLYDTYRRALQDDPEQGLDQAARWLREGIAEEAEAPLRESDQAVQRLAQGIDRAAEAVLGDEAEALRRAGRELERLAEELRDEVSRESGATGGGDSQEDSQGNERSAERRPSRQAGGDANSENAESGEPGESGDEAGGGGRGSGRQEDSQSEPDARGGGRGDEAADEERDGTRQGGQPGGSPGGRGEQDELEEAGGGGGGGGRFSDPRGGGSYGGRSGLEDFAELLRERIGSAPLTGEQFLDWSDRMRDVEEMLGDPELRAETARIRDRARSVRMDLKRHSEVPNWDLVQNEILRPLVELRDRVLDEARRRQGEQDLVPIDRDPVPAEFQEQVRRYYERLGSGR